MTLYPPKSKNDVIKKVCSQSTFHFPNNRINPTAANQCVQKRKVCGPAEEKIMTWKSKTLTWLRHLHHHKTGGLTKVIFKIWMQQRPKYQDTWSKTLIPTIPIMQLPWPLWDNWCEKQWSAPLTTSKTSHLPKHKTISPNSYNYKKGFAYIVMFRVVDVYIIAFESSVNDSQISQL